MLRVRDFRRYAHRAIHFGALPSSHGAWFMAAGRLHVSDQDNRGRSLRRNAGVKHPLVSYTWRQIIKHLAPTVALDIGANYGEVALCARYPANCKVFAIEANPALIPYLERSLATHPERAQIRLVDKAASDRLGRIALTIDEKWSGTSSLVGAMPDPECRFKGAGPERTRSVEVDAVTIDKLLFDVPVERLAIKLDVEGYEAHVLRGMRETLSRADKFVAIVECDGDNLRRAGTPAEETLALMREIGVVARFTPEGLMPVWPTTPLPEHCDVLLSSHRGLLDALVPLPRWLRRYLKS